MELKSMPLSGTVLYIIPKHILAQPLVRGCTGDIPGMRALCWTQVDTAVETGPKVTDGSPLDPKPVECCADTAVRANRAL